MFRHMLRRTCPARLLLSLLPVAGLCTTAIAQEQADIRDVSERRMFADILQEQKAIWTSPAHLKAHDAKWLLPLVVISGALIATDHQTSTGLAYPGNQLSASHTFSNAGLGALGGAAGAFYIFGHLEHKETAAGTGLLACQAFADSEIVSSLLKMATNRRRPDKPGNDGGFWTGGDSFPSGHTMNAFSIASVIASRYPEKRWLKYGSYGLATAVGVARFTGERHYPSDVFVGAVFGYFIGHYVARHR